MSCVFGESWRMRMSSIMRWRSGLAFACKEVMIGLLLENEADCLIRQHTEPRGGPPKNRTRWPEPLPRERFRSSTLNRRTDFCDHNDRFRSTAAVLSSVSWVGRQLRTSSGLTHG